jgi:hypothetical protein
LRNFVEGEARATQVSVDLPAVLVLAVCAASVARKVEVEINSGWREPVNLFAVVALPPAERKSVNFRDATAPLTQHERTEVDRLKAKVLAAETRYSICQQKLKRAERVAASTTGAKQGEAARRAARLSRELARMAVPALPRFVADDVTSEKLASLLVEQDGKIAIMSPEGGVFSIMTGRYSGGIPSFDVYLKGHAGDTLRVDRVGRKAEFVERPALTLGLAVQPDVLHRLAETEGVRERGLLARFLYAIPRSKLGRREINPVPLSVEFKEAYAAGIRSMLALAIPSDGAEPRVHRLRFAPRALSRFRRFESWLEPQLDEFGRLGMISDWAGKLAGVVARLSGILHIAKNVDSLGLLPSEIQRSTVKQAICIARYLIAHARVAFGEMGTATPVRQARLVQRWIERNAKRQFTKRELYEGVKGRFHTVAALEPSLDLLTAQGFILKDAPRRVVGRPSESYSVNPHMLPEASQYSQNTPANGSSTNFASNAKQKRRKEERRSRHAEAQL